MSEAVFPLLGAAFMVLVLLPFCALLTKAALVLLERTRLAGPLRALNLRYLLLTGSSLLPLAWFLSAGLHQLESGRSALACLLDHAGAKVCLEPGAFSLALALLFAAACARVVRRGRSARPAHSPNAAGLMLRLQRIVGTHPALRALHGRVVVTDTPGFTLGTLGWVQPQVVVGQAFAAQLSDDMLASALGHEAEHVRLLDPLRYFVLELALAVNPLGRLLLRPHAARWLAVHEAHCDREAVLRGCAPLALAQAIVRAARPHLGCAAALGARDTAGLRLRVDMLFAFAECAPRRCGEPARYAFPLACALLALALALPHQAGTAALDALHTHMELAATHFWL